MTPLLSAAAGRFTWSKLPNSRGFGLTRNGEILGTLRRPTIWSQNLEAATPVGAWTFRRSGFWRTGAEIVDPASHQIIATFRLGWSFGGTLTFADGQRFHVTSNGGWRLKPKWTVTTDAGDILVSL